MSCKICQGKFHCLICGGKPKKGQDALELKEVQRRLRLDFLGRIYNSMLKFGMSSTGLVGIYKGEKVIIYQLGEQKGDLITICYQSQKLEVPDSDVTEIVESPVDAEVLAQIGDPLAPGAKPYEPYYKPKKNEV